MSPNTSLLGAKNASASDLTPAPLAVSSSGVKFAFTEIPPPSILYVNVDDQLILSAATSASAEIVTVNARLQLPNGRIEDMQFTLAPANTRVVLKKSFPLAEGFLLSLSASAAVATTRGQTFVRVSLQRSASGVGQPACVLMADYVTTQSAPGYPNGRILSPTEGPGNVYTVSISNPAAGVDWTAILPTNTRWRVRGWNGNFTTSGVAANRFIQCVINSTPGICFTSYPSATAVATQVYGVSGSGVTGYTTTEGNVIFLPLPPDLVISNATGAAHTIGTITVNLQAADQWATVRLLVEEWLDNV